MTEVNYEQIWNIQEAINKAVATGKVVRFLSNESNEALRKRIVDKRGCKLLKKDKESNDIAVVPPGIDNFDFDEVDTKITLYSADGGKLC